MTASLIETNSLGGTVPVVPTFQGRAQVSWSTSLFTKNTVATGGGMQCVGFVDDGLSHQLTAVMSNIAQYPYFESSGSEGNTGIFNEGLNGVNSVGINKVRVDDFGCGEVDYVGVSSTSNARIAALILSGRTLDNMAGTIVGQTVGHHSVTGLGFQPQLVLFSWWGWNQYGKPSSSSGNTGQWSFGAYDGSSQWSCGVKSAGWLSGGASRRSRFSQSAVSTAPDYGDIQAVSLDADGFTLNYVGARGYVIWQAFADPNGQFAVGTGVQGDTSITPGFQAEAVVFGHSGTTALDTNQGGNVEALGGCDGLLNQHSGFAKGTGGFTPGYRYWSDTAISITRANTIGPSPPTVTGQASVTAFNPTTVDLSWNVDNGDNVLFGWVAFKASSAAGYEGCGGVPQQIYRWLKR